MPEPRSIESRKVEQNDESTPNVEAHHGVVNVFEQYKQRLEFWIKKHLHKQTQQAEQSGITDVQKQIEAHPATELTQPILVETVPKPEPTLPDQLQSLYKQLVLRLVDRAKNPDAVSEAMTYLRTAAQWQYDFKNISGADYTNVAKRDKQIAALQRAGYVLDPDHSFSKRANLRRPIPFSPTAEDRRNLDHLADRVEQPTELLIVLDGVGLKMQSYLFSKETYQSFEQVCLAADRQRMLLQNLGKDCKWSIVDPKDFSDVVRNLQQPELQRLNDPATYQRFVQFVGEHNIKLVLANITELIAIALDDDTQRVFDALTTGKENQQYGQYRLRSLHTVQTKTDVMPLLTRMAKIGMYISEWDIDSFNTISGGNYERDLAQEEQNTVKFATAIHERFDHLTDSGLLERVSAWHELTGLKVDQANVNRIEYLSPQWDQVIALATMLHECDPRLANRLHLHLVGDIINTPGRLAECLDPQYSAFLGELKSSGVLALGKFELPDFVGYGPAEPALLNCFKDPTLRQQITQPAFVEYAHYLQSSDASFRVTAQSIGSLATTARDGLVPALRALPALGFDFVNHDQITNNSVQLMALCEPARAGILSRENFLLICQRVQILLELSTTSTAIANQRLEFIGQVANQIMSGESKILSFLDDALFNRMTRYYAEVKTAGRTVEEHGDEPLQITDEDLAAIPDYIAATPNATTVPLRQLFAFVRQPEAIAAGRERLRPMRGSTVDQETDFVSLVNISTAEQWQAADEIMRILSTTEIPSAEVMAAINQDMPGFVATVTTFKSLHIVNSLTANESALQICALIPFRKTIEAVLDSNNNNSDASLTRLARMVSGERLALCNTLSPVELRLARTHLIGDDNDVEAAIQRTTEVAICVRDHPDVVVGLTQVLGAHWKVDKTDLLKSLTAEQVKLAGQAEQKARDPNLPPPLNLDALALYLHIEQFNIGSTVELLQQRFGYKITDDEVPAVQVLQGRDPAVLEHITQLINNGYDINIRQILKNISTLDYLLSPEIQTSLQLCREAGVDPQTVNEIANNAQTWFEAGKRPEQLKVFLRLRPIFKDARIGDLQALQPFVTQPELEHYVIAAHQEFGAEFSAYKITALQALFEKQAAVTTVHTRLGVNFAVILENHDLLVVVEELDQQGQLDAITQEMQQGYKLKNYRDLIAWKGLLASENWARYQTLREQYAIPVQVMLDRPQALDAFRMLEPTETNPVTVGREQQLLAAELFALAVTDNGLRIFDQLQPTIIDAQGNAIAPSEYARGFMERYAVQDQGKGIMVLLAAREYHGQAGAELVRDVFAELVRYDQLLAAGSSDRVPVGLRASIGMEYEITTSTAEGYKEAQPKRDFKKDICDLSKLAGIGQGNDAVHEIATRPTDNPRVMLLQMKLLQELGFMDFNFATPGYERGAHGMHLTIGGEHGLRADDQVNFLQNVLTIAGWGGVSGGKDLDYVEKGRGSAVRARDNSTHLVNVFGTTASAVELRALSIDQWEPFERTVLTAHHAAIAIQAVEKYGRVPNASVVDDRVLTIIDAWKQLQVELRQQVEHHNTGFMDDEQNGYLSAAGDWVEVEDFGGKGNRDRFASVLKDAARPTSLDSYALTTRIDPTSLYRGMDTDLANSLSRITNLFMKPSVKTGGDSTNAQASLQVTKLNNQTIEDSAVRASRQSMFDRKFKQRQGYYAIQGASEEMIIHASQRSLLKFNNTMEAVLAAPATASVAEITQAA